MHFKCLLAISLLLALPACTSSIVTKEYAPATSDATGEGLLYFLPMRMAELTVQRKPFPPDLPGRILRAQQAVASARAKADEAEQELKRLTSIRDRIPASDPARAKADEEVTRANAALQVARAERDKAERDLETAQQQYAAQQAGAKSVYDVKLELKPPQPDTSRAFVAHLEHWETRDDAVTIGTTADGLLTTSEVTTTDRIGDILVEIAGTVGLFLGAPPVPLTVQKDQPTGIELEKAAPCATAGDIRLKFVFDPTDYLVPRLKRNDGDTGAAPAPLQEQDHADDMLDPAAMDSVSGQQVNQTLMTCAFPFMVHFVPLGVDLVQGEPTTNEQDGADEQRWPGLLYRRSQPYLAVIEWDFGKDQKGRYAPFDSVVAMLPNEGPMGLLPYDASAFVKTDYKVELQDGQPVKWSANRPSALAEVFRLPVRMAKALVEIPAELIKIRLDIDTAEAARATSEVELLKARLAILCEQKRLEVARSVAAGDPVDSELETLLSGTCAL